MAKPTDEQLAKAQAYGVEIDARWSASTLEEKLAEAQQKADATAVVVPPNVDRDAGGPIEPIAQSAPVNEGVPVLLLRDFWDADGARHSKGEVVNVPTATARALLEAGKGKRADPLPGEVLQ